MPSNKPEPQFTRPFDAPGTHSPREHLEGYLSDLKRRPIEPGLPEEIERVEKAIPKARPLSEFLYLTD